MTKYVRNKSDSEVSVHKLAGISETSHKMLIILYEYLGNWNLSIEDAFDVFDADGSGHIGYAEFNNILDRVCGN